MSTTLISEPDQTTEVTETDPWFMAGTEGTGTYRVVAQSSFGRVGYRVVPSILAPSFIRIRLEPADEAHAAKIATTLTRDAGWKQPGDGGQNRFSTITLMGEDAVRLLEVAFAIIKRGRPITYNPAKPDYAVDLTS